MDHAGYHVVYVDKRVSQDLDGRHLEKNVPDIVTLRKQGSWIDRKPDCFDIILPEAEEVRNNLRAILTTFNGVHPCASSSSCLVKLTQLEAASSNLQPTLVIMQTVVEVEYDHRQIPTSRTSTVPTHGLPPPAAHKLLSAVADPKDRHGLALLQYVSAEISNRKLSRLIVPIAMIHNWEINTTFGAGAPVARTSRPHSGGLDMSTEPSSFNHRDLTFLAPAVDPRRLQKCLDAGATDVLVSPLQPDRVYALTAHAYRARKQASKERAEFLAASRLRKRSWAGLDNYAYLLEDMVSELVTGICNPNHISHGFDTGSSYTLNHSENQGLATAIATWGFSAHEYSEEQLVQAAFLMLHHALAMPELEKWRLPAADLKLFLLASRAAYNSFVHYHNFRHVVDVMQAIFYFLLQLGALPPYPASTESSKVSEPASTIASLLKPFDALTLLIAAIGHDVGHPGVNNAFLVALKAPLAQLYNDKSVLESFHCAAYSQILRRYWKQAFEDIPMHALLINSILATDMGLHFKYMADLKDLTEATKEKGIEGCNPQRLDEYRILTCALLVKCADISNVARPFDVAARWSDFLQLEFANQGEMETKIGVPTTLFGGPPELGNLIKLANSQIGFMNIFARPLFEGVTQIMPTMSFAINEMKANQNIWDERIRREEVREQVRVGNKKPPSEGSLSPRSESPSRSSNQLELSHPEGLPASRATSGAQLPSWWPLKAENDQESGLDLGLSDPTSNELPGLSPRSQSEGSRRSSLGLPPGYVISRPDSTSYSRRSSGAYPATNPIIPSSSTRRSSNTVASQLQLGAVLDVKSQASTSISADENVQPRGHGSEDAPWRPNVPNTMNTRHSEGSVLLGSNGGHGGGSEHMHRGLKSNDTSNYRSARYTANPSTGQISAIQSHNRDSSGAQTSITRSQPYSPTETQATSFLTVDSDDKNYHNGGEWSNSIRKDIPNVVDVERPGSGHKFGESELVKSSNVKTSVAKGHTGIVATNGMDGHRIIARRKSSRFLTFWKKRGKNMDVSP